MDIIFSTFKKIFSNIFRQSENLKIKQVTKKNLPFFVGWIAIILWVDCYALPIGSVSKISHISKISPTNIFSYLYPLSTAAFICLFDVRKLLSYVKFSGVIVMIGVSTEIVFGNSPISYIGIVFAGVGFGHIVASTGYGFFLILNNSEKLYSVSLGILLSKILLLLKVNFADSNTGDSFFNAMQIVGIALIFICSWFYRGADIYELFESSKKPPLKDYTILIPAYVVLVFNDFLAPTLWRSLTTISPFTLNAYHGAGVLLGIVFIILLQQVFRCDIYYALNFSFVVLTLGFVINLLPYRSQELYLFSVLLFGVSYAMGFISMYYMLGIIVKKSRSLTFYRIGIFLSSLVYIFGFSLIKVIKDVNSKNVFSITSLFSVACILIVFMLTPFFTKILYSGEWTDDLYRPDVTYESRLSSHLNESKLSLREIEVCILLLEGYTMRQISAVLSIAYSTVNTYCTSIYRKLRISSKTELVVMFSKYLSK